MSEDLPRTTLVRIIDELSETLLTVLEGVPSDAVELGGVAFHDPVASASGSTETSSNCCGTSGPDALSVWSCAYPRRSTHPSTARSKSPASL